ncbi:MAG TPA: family 1 glycosylhydrolase, partial [Candidatus Ozemobacteraceae bacterium]|nr:family 1 glycosylhydrolase [Candidatus Ozemobacteraceae bacterium]
RWMKELGQKAVIVSLEWSRIEPNPKQYDQAAIDHYREVFKQLRAQGIEPIVVLWDRTLPSWVSAYTGLEVPGVILDFSDFAGQAAKQFGDLVDVWVPVRDPVGAASKAFKHGVNPPGKTDVAAFSKAVISLLAMHRGAREALMANDTTAAGGKKACEVGLIASMRCIRPNRAEHPMDQTLAKTSEHFSRAFVDAIMKGDLTVSSAPTDSGKGKGGFGKMPVYTPAAPPSYDKRLADFLAIQYEGLEELKFNPLFPLFTQKIIPPGAVRDGAGQISFAEGLTQLLASLKKYPVPMMVIVSAFDAKGFDRVAHLREHAAATLKAIGNGCAVKGLFYDSLLSGFEYEYGYSLHKGLLRVNRQVQERKPTMVAKAFARLAKGAALHAPTDEDAADSDTPAAPGGADQPPVPAQPGESAGADPSAQPPASSDSAEQPSLPAQPGESVGADPSAGPGLVPGGADQPPRPATTAD